MILKIHGSEGWKVKMQQLVDRASHLSRQLFDMGVGYYRNPYMNIVAIKTPFISKKLANKYRLVADSYEDDPKWWKIVVMSHVKQGVLDQFIMDLKAELYTEVNF